MWNLTDSQAVIVAAGFTLLGGLIAWFGRGIAFVLQRKVTDAKAKEQVTYYRDVVDLSGRLAAAGMTIDDAKQFEALLRAPAANHGEAAKKAIDILLEPAAFDSSFAMRLRADAANEVARSKLQQVLTDLNLMLDDRERDALDAAQKAWQAYIESLSERSFIQFEGGSNATLAMMITGLTETERRIEELRAEVHERAAIYDL